MEKVFSKHSTFFFASLFFFASIAKSQMCLTPGSTIYGLSSNGNIVPVTVSNAAVGSPINATSYSGSGGASANALGYNTVNGKFYYFQNNSSGGQVFMSYDPLMNVYTVLATSPITSTVNRGCVSFNGTGYYCLDQNGNLCFYNISNNTWVLIGKNFTDQYGATVTTFT
ncbi:MAG TPA: hypothetical protein VKT28_02920, partial [Puia sp.]|nr:hypothetical protein [Puia sp.]